MESLLCDIRQCRECEIHLPLGPRPVLSAGRHARILIIGQAPGLRVHKSGVPWNDASGKRLREWLGINESDFYDPSKIAIVPMGFCYPGTGKSGDLPPRPECAPLWHDRLLSELKHIELTLLIGTYAQSKYLNKEAKPTLTKTVQAWREYAPRYLPLPHPSPRNNRWLKKNPWFDKQIIPYLKKQVTHALLDH